MAPARTDAETPGLLKPGEDMKRLFAVVLSAAAFCALSPSSAEEDCRLQLVASLPISASNPHRVIIPASLNGKSLQLAIDTGSGASALSKAAADRLGLEPQIIADLNMRPFLPYAGGRATHYVRAPNFTLGEMRAPIASFFILPSEMSEADGFMGADFLRQFDVEIDFANGKLNLFKPHRCADKVVYWTQDAVAVVPFESEQADKHIHLHMKLDGVDVPTELDTGAPNTSISLRTAKAWFGLDEKSPGMEEVRGGGSYHYRFKALSLEGITVQNPVLLIHDVTSSGKTDDFSALLGITILHQLHVYIAYKEHKLYVTSADAH